MDTSLPRSRLARWLAKHPRLQQLRLRLLTWPAVASMAVLTAIVIGAGVGTAPSIPGINLSSDPLYAAATQDKPTIALALSVEFPTVGAQYVDVPNTTTDGSYANTKEYLGYYDAESCYVYNNAPLETPASGLTSTDYKRFDRVSPATNRMCDDAFSGNFLNWATSSAIDMLRIALTGGDRYIDETRLTVLQRAVIPNGDPSSKCLMNSTNFPGKQLTKNGGGTGKYWGAIPLSLRTAATAASTSGDFWIANTLNRIFFGSANGAANDCSSTATNPYIIGDATSGVTAGTFTAKSTSLPADAVQCATNGNTCSITGTQEVWYGIPGGTAWNVTITSANIVCNAGPFTSPGGTASSRRCYNRPVLNTDSYFYSRVKVCHVVGQAWASGTAYTAGEIVRDANTQLYMRKTNGAGTTTPSSDSTNWSDMAWVSGTVYAVGDIRRSAVDGNYYVRKIAGAGTTDPASDNNASNGNTANWMPLTTGLQDVRDPTAFVANNGLCLQYPNANYKPVGAIQKYNDQLRIAAMGYVIESPHVTSASSTRFGGVLRAPMKFVGPRTYDLVGQDAGANPKAEWDSATGVFTANPESDATYNISGVINYVNKFGRTGTANEGHYKYYDPMNEMYYETLRYLQGLQPSSAAVSSLTATNYDGFPIYTTWTDPYGGGRTNASDYSCLRANIAVIGDKNNSDPGLPGRLPSASAANNIPDATAWTNTVKNFENNVSSTYVDGAGVNRTTGNPNTTNGDPNSHVPDYSMIGLAYWAHTHDIRGTSWTGNTAAQRPGLRVKTFTFDVNEFSQSTPDDARRHYNQLFLAAKYGGFETSPNSDGNPYNSWGNPFKAQANATDFTGTTNNNVWQDFQAAGSSVPARVGLNAYSGQLGEANTYYLQSGARGVLSAFNEIFKRAGAASRSIAGSAIQNKNLGTLGDTIYQGSFDTSDWSGDLIAQSVTLNASNTVAIGSNIWTAATRLAGLANPNGTRNIVAGLESASAATFTAVPFLWANVNGTVLGTQLDKITPASVSDGLAADRVAYLRGDKTKEGNPFRSRNKLMGDVINSGVALAGSPTVAISGTSYAAFYTTAVNRTPTVFVGANDGMLHAFNANTGDEAFAYIPSWMGSKLAALTDITYLNNHQVYVDAPPAVAEAQTGNAGTAADWKTVLVSGTGGGGRGVFALDVTNPYTFTYSNVMWEFTHNDDPDMGYVIGRPQIMKVRTSAVGSAATYRWFAVVASGVNSYVKPNNSNLYGDGSPALFLIALDKPAGTAWTLGTNYFKVNLPVNSSLSATLPTGTIGFSTVLDAATLAMTQVYMGDLHGNLWKLDFSPWGTSDWNMAKLTAFTSPATSAPYPLYIAKDGSGNVQPITMAPSLIAGPTPGTQYVFFGTGKYMEIGDKTSTTTQSVYTILDNGTTTPDKSPASASVITDRARLQAGTLNTGTFTVSVPAFKWGRAGSAADATQRSGWYFDLVYSGEREVGNAKVVGNNITFNTLIPSANSGGACTSGGGGGNAYQVNIDTGTGTFTSSTVGLLGEPLVANIVASGSGGTTYSKSDNTGRRIKTVTAQVFQLGSGGVAVGTSSQVQSVTGRLSWRQINNYQDLKSAP